MRSVLQIPINFRDPRWFQISFLSFFLIYGIFFLDWEMDITRYLVIFGSAIIAQIVCTYFTTKDYSSIKSALISALSLCLLLKTNLYATAVIAAVITIASKFLIRYNNKHIFNPANFGIIATILLTGDAWLSPGQWGNSMLLLFIIGITGFAVLFRVGRIDTSIAFISTFFALEFMQNVIYKGWPLDYVLHEFSSGTLLLFTFFMITDPKTTPNSSKARIIWSVMIALLAFFLTNWFYVHAAPVWALVISAPVTALLDKVFIHQKFSWT
ncbi:MAG: Na+-transporting NADH:ubiquinone oxidoreductase, subunit NqrB [Chitinophagales bacterium]|nr:Na+-transporting NADH:ubiquinone oxidoreductase, subunit NqrB [Chitinophagales bacterium]